jgi:hypothetical protein
MSFRLKYTLKYAWYHEMLFCAVWVFILFLEYLNSGTLTAKGAFASFAALQIPVLFMSICFWRSIK